MPSTTGYDFVCEDTGIHLQIHKVPFTVINALFKQYEKINPSPTPPVHVIDYGDEKISEPNYADPAYHTRLERYEQSKNIWVNEESKRVFADIAIDCDVDAEAVKTFRDSMTRHGIEISESDKYIYVWMIAIGTILGHNELIDAIQKRSKPTKEAVENAKATFPGPV